VNTESRTVSTVTDRTFAEIFLSMAGVSRR